MHWRGLAPEELMDLRRDGPAAPPLDERVEEQLAASVRVFLPSVQLVVDLGNVH